MRILVREATITGCAKAVSRKVKEGWTPITKIKIDDSSSYNDVQYVCVMEQPDTPEMLAKRAKGRFNTSMVGRL